MQCSIIMYHYVRKLKNSKYPNIKALEINYFLNQIKYFKRFYKFISYNDLLESIYGGKKIPNNSIILTFDDGLIDHYETIFPILLKENIQGLFFPLSSPIFNNIVPDVNKIHFILASVKSLDEFILEIFKLLNSLRLDGHLIKDNEELFHTLAVADDDDFKEVIFIKRLLQHHLPLEIRSKLINSLFKKYVTSDEKLFSKNLYMNRSQLMEMKNKGMIFGNHGKNHLWLNNINNEQQILEIESGLEFLKYIGVNINDWGMCYPYGGYNKSLINNCINLGCKIAFTTNVGISNINFSNRYKLERFDTNHFPKKEYKKKIFGLIKLVKI